MQDNLHISSISKKGKIGIYFLKEIWKHFKGLRNQNQNNNTIEWTYINAVFNTLGIGTEPTIKHIMETNCSFEDFEDWILLNGEVSTEFISHFNSIIDKENDNQSSPTEHIFNTIELEQWDKNGYIILKDAISKADCQDTVNSIYNAIEANPSNPDTWYKKHALKQGIMIQLFNSPMLNKNRFSKTIRLAYEQLWNRSDLMVSMDRVSFNPPERKDYQFQGPNLHWDVSLKKPIPYGLQGLLYLSDTNEHQGAFTVIPGFHNTIDTWLETLDDTMNPRDAKSLSAFKTKAIAAEAGDFIIWNQCLPHGSSPNTSTKPRIVQYINYQPLNLELHEEWI